MDEVRSPKLGVRPSAADRISGGGRMEAAMANRPGASRPIANRLVTGRPADRGPAINPLLINLAVVGAVLIAAIGITFFIWHDVGRPALTQRAPEARPEVQEIEQLLSDLSFAPGTIDGVVDAETTEAIRAFQQAAGLPEDGQPSPALLEELKAVAGQ